MTRVVHGRDEFAKARDELTPAVGLVLTMGALHAGHAALLAAARAANESVVATVFVNPMQFGPTEDLSRYPRTLAADVEVCERAGVDLVWAPEVGDVYPDGSARVTIAPGPLGAQLEGASRPTHFAGMLTVVAKFLNLIRPQHAYFGEKDYQQLTLIRRMVLDLDLGVQIVGVPTVREADGLALSSRNVFLSPPQRAQAVALSRALFAGRDAVPGAVVSGAVVPDAAAVLAAATAELAAEPGIEVDYLALRGSDLGAVPAHGAARLLVAARVGNTRLIDNVEVAL